MLTTPQNAKFAVMTHEHTCELEREQRVLDSKDISLGKPIIKL